MTLSIIVPLRLYRLVLRQWEIDGTLYPFNNPRFQNYGESVAFCMQICK